MDKINILGNLIKIHHIDNQALIIILKIQDIKILEIPTINMIQKNRKTILLEYHNIQTKIKILINIMDFLKDRLDFLIIILKTNDNQIFLNSLKKKLIRTISIIEIIEIIIIKTLNKNLLIQIKKMKTKFMLKIL
jgi:hypothetical protein